MDFMDLDSFRERLESLLRQVFVLKSLEGVSPDSALYAFLLTAEYGIDSALYHVDEYDDYDYVLSFYRGWPCPR